MKKYKLLNTKNIFIGLGATTAIVAPVTTLVACGGKTSHKNVDINGAIKAADTSLINKVMFQSYSGFTLGSEMIAENILNSRSEGILKNISRAIDLGENSLFGGEYNDAAKIAKLTNGKTASLSFEVKKSEINKDGGFDKIASDFVSKIDKLKQYFATIKSNVKDDAVTNNVHESGSWTISLYEQSNIPQSIIDSASLLSDSSKFTIDEKQVADMGGTYTMATKHIFSESDSKNSIHGFKTTPKGSLNDRSVEDHLKSWTGFGPIADTSMTQADKDLLKTVKVTAYPEEDRKTHEWHTVLSIWNDSGVKTIYINTSFVGKFASNKPLDMNDLKTQLKYKSNFMKFYDFMHANASSLGSLPSLTTPHFIMLANELPTMAKLSDLVGDDSFLNDLFAYIAKESPNFDKNTFYWALKNMEDKPFGSPMDWGAKRYSILYFLGQFYSLAHRFVESTDGAKYVPQIKQITSADDFYKTQKEEKEWNDFVKAHQSIYDMITSANSSLTRAQLKDKILVEVKIADPSIKTVIDQISSSGKDVHSLTLDQLQTEIQNITLDLLRDIPSHIEQMSSTNASWQLELVLAKKLVGMDKSWFPKETDAPSWNNEINGMNNHSYIKVGSSLSTRDFLRTGAGEIAKYLISQSLVTTVRSQGANMTPAQPDDHFPGFLFIVNSIDEAAMIADITIQAKDSLGKVHNIITKVHMK